MVKEESQDDRRKLRIREVHRREEAQSKKEAWTVEMVDTCTLNICHWQNLVTSEVFLSKGSYRSKREYLMWLWVVSM